MILKADEIVKRLNSPVAAKRLIVQPITNLAEGAGSGSASIDLRLGTWFVELRRAKQDCLRPTDKEKTVHDNIRLSKTHYTPFGGEFVLHPGAFVLGATLEWIRLPNDLAAYVIGKSSWGRLGLIIATATGVHPGFTGCLTLEITNVGEIPIGIKPGMPICQLFVHRVESDTDSTDSTTFLGYRKPVLRDIKMDTISKRLSEGFH